MRAMYGLAVQVLTRPLCRAPESARRFDVRGPVGEVFLIGRGGARSAGALRGRQGLARVEAVLPRTPAGEDLRARLEEWIDALR